MSRARLLLGTAVAAITWWAAIFAITQQVSVLTGLYWAVETATTVGYGDVTPHGTGGRFLAVACMLTTIPLLAAAFGQIHLDKVKAHLDEHHRSIHRRLDDIERGAK